MSDTIKEFLVGLGFKIDATSEKKFVEGVQKATEQALALGAAMQAVAATITAAVVKIARDMDQMAYASERLGSSVKDIKAVSYAIGQMGGSAQGALSSMEGIARFMRNSPGGTGFIRHLVGDKVDVKDTAAVMDALAVKFREMPYYLAKARAEVIGIDEQTLQAMVRGMDKFSAEYRAKMGAAGLNPEKLAADSKKFMQTWNGMWQSVEMVGQKIAANLMPYLGREIERFAEWLDKHSAKISYYVTRFAEAALEVATFIRDAIFRLGDIDPAVKRVLAVLGALMGVAWALGGPIRILLLLGAAILLLYDDYKAWKNGSEHFIDWDKWAPAIQNAWEWIKKIASAINSAAEAVGGWQNVAMAFAAYMATKWVADILGAFTKVGDGASKLAKGGPGRMGLLGLLGVAGGSYMAYQHGKDAIDGVMDRLPATAHQREVYEKEKNLSTWDRAKRAWNDRPKWLGGSGGTGTGSGPYSVRGRGIGRALNDDQKKEMATAIRKTAADLGVPPEDIATAISYETGGTMHPWQKGPRTQWGQHRGLIQWGEPQRKKYGVTENSTITEQMAAVTRYLKDAGVKPGMGLLDIYSAINAGRVGRYNASDAGNGGAPGTVADKVRNQMGSHRSALAALGNPAKEQKDFWGTMLAWGQKELGVGSAAAATNPSRKLPSFVEGVEGAKRAFDPKRFDFAPALGGLPAMNAPNQTTLHQKTEINVMGGSDPAATASYVERAQLGVNQNMMRNFTSQVR
ncbi:hypothetical protein ACFONL_12680 [Camelimonas fluminis]|uniref:Transglycosylase-like protein with SLT domain n=1 Tax=Camelimonas fluminis TaxID=1576911 RepID=A0ABV7UI90_9HYPH|nr:hypothetical protein [Camelimonas fluminis]